MRVLVLFVRRYAFKGKSGEQVEGVTVQYVAGEPEQAPDRTGQAIMEASCPLAMASQLHTAPGVYELSMTIRPGQRNRAQAVPERWEFVAAFDLAKGLAGAKPIHVQQERTG